MMTEMRWKKECEVMKEFFPEFEPEVKDGTCGFRGKIPGPRTKCLYGVVLEASTCYPSLPPEVYIFPHLGSYVSPGGILSLNGLWNPVRSSFANWLLHAVKYVHEFDGR